MEICIPMVRWGLDEPIWRLCEQAQHAAEFLKLGLGRIKWSHIEIVNEVTEVKIIPIEKLVNLHEVYK